MPKYEKYMLQPVPTFPHLTFNFQSGESRICNSYFSHRQDIFSFYQRVCLSFFPRQKNYSTSGHNRKLKIMSGDVQARSGGNKLRNRNKKRFQDDLKAESFVDDNLVNGSGSDVKEVSYLSITFKAWMSYLEVKNLMQRVSAPETQTWYHRQVRGVTSFTSQSFDLTMVPSLRFKC